MSSRLSALAPLLFLVPFSAHAQQRSCTLTSVPVSVRTEGLSELVGDVIISCSGGTPAAIGTSLPLFTVQATLPTQAGNRVLTGGFTDALLLVGEPDSFQQYPCTADPCGAVAGTPPGLDPGLNRNVYQGRLTSPNTISFTVPIDGGPQTLRIVNLRISGAPVSGSDAAVTVSLSGPAAINVTPNSVVVARPSLGLDFAVRSPDNATAGVARLDKTAVTGFPLSAVTDFQFNLRFSETGLFGFRARSVVATSDSPSAVVTQARPGQLAEARFQMSETGYYNQSFPAINGLSAAGLADSGTRLMARFANIPKGAALYVSAVPIAEYSSSGITARLLNADANGAGAFVSLAPASTVRGVAVAQLPVVNGQATAVWEVLAPTIGVDRLTFGAFLSYGSPVADATVTVQPQLGPLSPTGTVSTPPRFTPAQNPVNAVVIGAGGGGVTPSPGGALAVTAPPALPVGTAGVAYPPFFLTATPLLTGLTWTVVEGIFPPGMLLSPAGLIGGVPLFPGAYAFTVRVQGPFGEVATARLGIVIGSSRLTASSVGTVNGQVGTAITPLALMATGGSAPLRWFAPSTNFPPGLTLNDDGIVSGVPSVEGFFSVPMFVQDSVGATTSVTATFVISGLLRITTPSPLPAATAGAPYRSLLQAAGGTPPYRWAIASGALPLGLGLDSSGAVNGVAIPAPGRFVLEITDAAGQKAQRAFTIDTATETSASLLPSPAGFRFAFASGASPATQLLRLGSTSATPQSIQLSVATENGGDWLSVDRNQVSVSQASAALIPVQVNPRGLSPGSYSGIVQFSLDGTVRWLPVNVVVSSAPVLSLAPTGLVFTAGEGGPAPVRQRVHLSAANNAAAASWRANANVAWLRVTTSSVTIPSGQAGFFDVDATPGALRAGEHWGEIQVFTEGGGPAQTITVLLRVLPAGLIPPVTLSTSSILVTSNATSGFVLSNTYQLPVSYFTGRDFGGDPFSWFSITPPSNAVESGADQAIALETRPSLEPGVRRGAITLSFAGGPPRTVEITAIQPAANCRPSRLIAAIAAPGSGQVLTTGLPAYLEARIANDCGEALTAGAVTLAAPAGGAPLFPLGDGRWVGTWTPVDAAPGPWTLTLAARSVDGRLEGAQATTVMVEASPLPSIQAVVTGGTFSRFRPLAPAGFFTVLGSFLTDRNGAAPVVTVGDQRADVVFASANQLNLRLPLATPTGLLPLVVRRDGQLSASETVAVAATAPDVFVFTNPAFEPISVANPAAPGDVLVIFCTGLGATSSAGAVVAPVTVVVGGVPAEVLGAAAAPGFPGLYQVAVRLGALTPAGESLLLLTAGGRSSPLVPIATRR